MHAWTAVLRVASATLALMVASLSLSGCFVVSLEPLYSQDTLVPVASLSPPLVGRWGAPEESQGETWEFSEGTGGAVRLRIVPADVEGQTARAAEAAFDVHVLRLGDSLLLDLFPEAPPDMNEYLEAHLVPAHSFFAVELTSAALTIRMLDESWLLDQLESGRMSLSHHRHEGMVLLTASTKLLQQALAGRVGEAFGDPQTLERLP